MYIVLHVSLYILLYVMLHVIMYIVMYVEKKPWSYNRKSVFFLRRPNYNRKRPFCYSQSDPLS